MGLFDAIGDVLDVGIEFSDALFGFGAGNETWGLLSAGSKIFSGAMGEDIAGLGGGGVPGIAGGDLFDLVDPGFGGSEASTGSGLLAKQLSQVRKARPKSDFWSNPFVGHIAANVGGALLAPDPGDVAYEQAEARRKSIAKNYRLPRRKQGT